MKLVGGLVGGGALLELAASFGAGGSMATRLLPDSESVLGIVILIVRCDGSGPPTLTLPPPPPPL